MLAWAPSHETPQKLNKIEPEPLNTHFQESIDSFFFRLGSEDRTSAHTPLSPDTTNSFCELLFTQAADWYRLKKRILFLTLDKVIHH